MIGIAVASFAGQGAAGSDSPERAAMRERLAESVRLRQEGKLAEAAAMAEEALQTQERLLGRADADVAATAQWLAQLWQQQGDLAKAEVYWGRALQSAAQAFGKDSWRTADARHALAYVQRLGKLSAADRASLAAAGEKLEAAESLCRQGRPRDAMEPARLAVKTHKQLFADQPLYWTPALARLASVAEAAGEHLEAQSLYQEILRIQKAALGKHPSQMASLSRLASLYHLLGDYARAEPLLREAVEIARDTLGPNDPDYAASLGNLAEWHHARGDYARAEPLLREAVEIARHAPGDRRALYANSLNNLAGLYCDMGDYGKAGPLLDRVVEMFRELHGDNSPAYAASLNNLAGLYYSMGEYAAAAALFEQAAEIRRTALGERHPDYAASLDNLAAAYDAMGEHEKALPLCRRALEVRKEVLTETHPDYALSLASLAGVLKATGDYEQAERLYTRSLEVTRQVLGVRHPRYAVSLNNLASLYKAKREFSRAEPLYEQALAVTQQVLQYTAEVLSERQQLAMVSSVRRTLDGYLTVTAASDRPCEELYGRVLAWKGSVFVRQRRTRLAAARPELAPLLAELQQVSSRLATLALAVPDAGQKDLWQRQLAQLGETKERLEAELARRSEEFAGERRPASAAAVREALAEDVALVDFLEYAHFLPAPGEPEALPPQHLAAFVVRRDRPVVRVELGPAQPAAEAIDVWRGAFGRTSKEVEAARQLRRRLWEPLEKHLDGAAVVLVSPDGALARFPFAALPGKSPGGYLIEDRALAVVAVPQWLPELRRGAGGGALAIHAGASLLVVGDVDYGPSEQAAGQARGLQFAPLENTRQEIEAVRRWFETGRDTASAQTLCRQEATEAAFRRAVSGCRYLHLATHGFFCPPERKAPSDSAPPDRPTPLSRSPGLREPQLLHPGLLSGFALARANVPPRPGQYDGLLTAEEIASLGLRSVELVVLSACETGLGSLAGGEGVLGLQRAFQVSGARSVVASLWKVDDDATRQLMEGFYENLWNKRLSKLEALRQAQLALMRQGGDKASTPGRQRGLTVMSTGLPPATLPRRSPYYWAAFVLSGDWR